MCTFINFSPYCSSVETHFLFRKIPNSCDGEVLCSAWYEISSMNASFCDTNTKMPKSDTIRDNTLCTIRSQGSFFLLLLFDGLFCILYCSLSTIKKDNNCSALWILCYYYILNVSRLCLIFP